MLLHVLQNERHIIAHFIIYYSAIHLNYFNMSNNAVSSPIGLLVSSKYFTKRKLIKKKIKRDNAKYINC